jgi:hypothetical protein
MRIHVYALPLARQLKSHQLYGYWHAVHTVPATHFIVQWAVRGQSYFNKQFTHDPTKPDTYWRNRIALGAQRVIEATKPTELFLKSIPEWNDVTKAQLSKVSCVWRLTRG